MSTKAVYCILVAVAVVNCVDVKLKLDLGSKNNACDKWNKVMSAPLIGTLLKTVLDILFPTNCQSVSIPTDCSDVLLNNPSAASGLYMIGIGPNKTQIQVYCDMATSGGGWTVFQRRKDGSIDFRKGWDDYAHGFGTPNGEHWLGNDNLATLTVSAAATYKLRVDLSVNGESHFAEFDNFKIGGASDKYRLTVGAYTAGDADDGLTYNSGAMFTTFDQDNADCLFNCVGGYGPWWHKCCTFSNLNGVYGTQVGEYESIMWAVSKYEYIPFTEMKIRRM